MSVLFSPPRATLAGLALLLAAAGTASAADPDAVPAGGKYHDCHGYLRHVSDVNIRVHCIDGTPADLSFITVPKLAGKKDGKSVQVSDLRPGTPVHVIFTQSIGVRHAYKIFVADPNGHGLYGFKS